MKKFKLFIISLFIIPFGYGQTVPINWSDDSGIDVYQESTNPHGGNYCAKIAVNTGNQGICDFDNLTNIPVTAGNTYTAKFWYKTSDHVKARIVLKWSNGNKTWGNFTNAGATTWTELTQSGTVPSGVTSVTLDIRFYDQSGFSPGEIQYIDDLTFESPTGTQLTVTNGDLELWPSSVEDPTEFGVSHSTISDLYVGWSKNANNDNVLVAYSTDGTFGTPANGTTYSAGDAIPGGGTVVYYGSDTTVTHSGLSKYTVYNYKAWSYDGSEYSNGVTTAATTLDDNPEVPTGWTTGPDIQTYKEAAPGNEEQGTYSCKVIVNSTTANNCKLFSSAITVTPGNTVKFYGYFKTYPDAHVYAKLTVNFYNSSGGYVSTLSTGSSPMDGNFNKIQKQGTVPADAATAKVIPKFFSTDAKAFVPGGIIYVDDLTFESPSGTIVPVTNSDFESWASNIKPEPSNHVANFTAGTPTPVSIPLTWNDNDGAVAADGFLLMINRTGSFTAPTDGVPENDDTDVSDGTGQVNVNHGDEAYTWSGLDPNTHYYFTIYPYTNSGTNINYKTDGTVPTTDATTAQANVNLIISEVADPKSVTNSRFVELYNSGSSTIDFSTDTWYLARQANGGNISSVQLTGTIAAGDVFVIAKNQSDFNSNFGFNPDQTSGIITGNGDDGYFLYYGGDNTTGTLIDAYGVMDEDGTGKDWEYKDGHAVRKRNVTTHSATWNSGEWLVSLVSDTLLTPGKHHIDVTWVGGNNSNKWYEKTNWNPQVVPDISMNVTANSGNNPVLNYGYLASCWDYSGSDTVIVRVNNSNGSTQGSLIVGGTASGKAKARLAVTSGQWHGISTPVSGQTAMKLYKNGSPNVWVKSYDEATNGYTYITDLNTPLGDAKGWMIWIDASASTQVFDFVGPIRSGTVSTSDNIVRSQAGADYGYNFVGNPFTSTIDWDAASGWTKTNLENAIYTYNNGNWVSYVDGVGTNGGNRYISYGQGFFVQVKDNGSTSGTLEMTPDICVSKNNGLLKGYDNKNDQELLRLNITDGSLNDETVVRFKSEATEEYDSQYDARKLLSFNTDYPQIFTTSDGYLSINTLPLGTGIVPMDVKGKDGEQLTISATEINNINEVWLIDNQTGAEVNLTKNDYTFTYDNEISNRFSLIFGVTGINDNEVTDLTHYYVYGSTGMVNILIPENEKADVEIYNIMGQKIAVEKDKEGLVKLALPGSKYYIVKVTGIKKVETKKVFVK